MIYTVFPKENDSCNAPADFSTFEEALAYCKEKEYPKWVEVSEKHVVRSILRACPKLTENIVVHVLRRDGDGHYFDFEVSDWVKYFKLKYYLKEVK